VNQIAWGLQEASRADDVQPRRRSVSGCNGAGRMMPKTLAGLLHPGRDWPVIALAAVLFLLPAPGQAADQAPPAAGQTATPPPTTAIPPAEIATRATEIPDLLRTLTTTLAPSPAMATIQQSLPEFSGQTDREFAATLSALQEEQPTLETLQAQQQSWQRRQLQATGWLVVFPKWIWIAI